MSQEETNREGSSAACPMYIVVSWHSYNLRITIVQFRLSSKSIRHAVICHTLVQGAPLHFYACSSRGVQKVSGHPVRMKSEACMNYSRMNSAKRRLLSYELIMVWAPSCFTRWRGVITIIKSTHTYVSRNLDLAAESILDVRARRPSFSVKTDNKGCVTLGHNQPCAIRKPLYHGWVVVSEVQPSRTWDGLS